LEEGKKEETECEGVGKKYEKEKVKNEKWRR
jgi:hypothetical protein